MAKKLNVKITTAMLTDKEDALFWGIREAIEDCHGAAVRAGWYKDLKTGRKKVLNFGERIALCHSELSETLEAHRKSKKDDHLPHLDGVAVELADLLIRVFDLAGAENIDLAKAYIQKRRFNEMRADHKPENRAKTGGKKY